ncbi:MAG: LysR substrate-binding domain-containing protein [Rhodospirillales bacterium]
MARKHYNLPPLTSLAVFEAAARHGSFKRAAVELNVTPSAVSHQIKALEQEVGLALFLRGAGGSRLTAAGEELENVLARSFTQTAAVLDRLRRQHSAPSVTVGATTAMASLWLMPRITRFWRDHPTLKVNQQASDLEMPPGLPQLDLRLRYGSGVWEGESTALLFHDRVAPVCSPEFAAAHPVADLADLARLPLIHMEGANPLWLTWPQWFLALDYRGPVDQGVTVNNHTIALQAAQDGNGLTLGWLAMIAPLLRRGLLQQIGNAVLPAPGSFYLTWRRDRLLSPQAQTLRDWLLADAAHESHSPAA